MQRLRNFLIYTAVFALIVFGAIFSLRDVRDLDVWLHLKIGQIIFESKSIPTSDIFSYTMFGKEWVNHEWLFQFIIFLVYKYFSIAGIIVFKTLILSLSLLFVFSIVDWKRAFFIKWVLAVMMIFSYQMRFAERPEIFSYLFLSAYLFIIHLYRYKSKNYLIFLIPLQILWTNVHGYWILGPIVVLVYLIGELIAWKVKMPFRMSEQCYIKGRAYLYLLIMFLLISLATIVNPFGLKGTFYPIDIIHQMLQGSSSVIMKGISELQSSLFLLQLGEKPLVPYGWFVTIAILGFLINFKRLDFSNLLLLALFTHMSYIAVRNIGFFSLVAFYITCKNIDTIFQIPQVTKILDLFKKKEVSVIAAALAIFFTFTMSYLILTNRLYRFFKVDMKTGLGINARIYPENAATFIQANNLSGNMFNTFDFGNYLIWRLYPDRKVFIDGRVEFYGSKFYKLYHNIHAFPAAWNELTGPFDINYTVILHLHSNNAELIKRFYNDPNWSLVYLDSRAAIFVHNQRQNQKIIRKYKNAVFQPQEKIISDPIIPDGASIGETTKAYFYIYAEDYKKAKVLCREAMKKSPESEMPHLILGLVYFRQNRLKEAEAEYKKALEKNKKSLDAYINLGAIYFRNGKKEVARDYWCKALKVDPRCYIARHNLKILTNTSGESTNELIKSKGTKPENADKRFNIALDFLARGASNTALEHVREALKIEPNHTKSLILLGDLYMVMDLYDLAEENFKKALKNEPHNVYLLSRIRKLYDMKTKDYLHR